MSVDHAFLDVLRNKNHAAKREAMQGGIYVVSHQSTPTDLGIMVRRITKCAGVNLEIIRDSIPCFVYFVVCAHNSNSFDRTVQIICETCNGAGFLFTIEQFIVIWECLNVVIPYFKDSQTNRQFQIERYTFLFNTQLHVENRNVSSRNARFRNHDYMRHSGNKWMSAVNDNGNLEFKSATYDKHFNSPLESTFDTDYYRRLFNYYYNSYNMAHNINPSETPIRDPAIITAIESSTNLRQSVDPMVHPTPQSPVYHHHQQQQAANGGFIIPNDEKLKDLLINYNLIFKAKYLKELPGGVIDGIKTSTLTDLLHFYNREDKTDLFLIAGLPDGCHGAIKQLHQIYGRSGIVYTTKQYFELLKSKKQTQRPVSISVVPSYFDRCCSSQNLSSSDERDEATYVMGSIYRPRSVIIPPCDPLSYINELPPRPCTSYHSFRRRPALVHKVLIFFK
ncbi:hypothetical protein ACOME3_006331 [Neoechinorhynchus agilis]